MSAPSIPRPPPARSPRSVVVARLVLGGVALAWLPIATFTALVLGSFAHLDWTSGQATAWGLHGLYALIGGAVGLVGSIVAAATAISMSAGRQWTLILGLVLAAGLVLTGLVVPGLVLAGCLLQADALAWLSSDPAAA